MIRTRYTASHSDIIGIMPRRGAIGKACFRLASIDFCNDVKWVIPCCKWLHQYLNQIHASSHSVIEDIPSKYGVMSIGCFCLAS